MKDLANGIGMAREIANSAALRSFTAREDAPGGLGAAKLGGFFHNGLGTFWHQSGTTKTGYGLPRAAAGRKATGVSRPCRLLTLSHD